MNFQSVNWQIIYLKGNIHAEDVLDLVQEVFEDCTEWDTELAAAATVPNNYQVMLDIGARKLWNPIALTDLAMYDLARSGQFVGNAVTWGSLSSGYAELEKLQQPAICCALTVRHSMYPTFEMMPNM